MVVPTERRVEGSGGGCSSKKPVFDVSMPSNMTMI